MNLRISLFLLGGIISTSLWAQDAPTVLSISDTQWTQGATFRYQVKTAIQTERQDEPQTSTTEWVLRVDTVMWNGLQIRFYSPQALQLYQFDPIVYAALEGRLRNLEALPYTPPLVYRTNKQGQISELMNLKYLSSVYMPYYINLRRRIEREISDPNIRQELMSLVALRLSEYGIQRAYDQFLGPLHAWYNQAIPTENPSKKIIYSTPPIDPTSIPYVMSLNLAEDKPRHLVIERKDEIYMERAAEMMLDYLYGNYTNRGEKTTYMSMIQNSEVDFNASYRWRFDKKKSLITSYFFEKKNHLHLVTELEPEDFYYRVEIDLK